MAKKIIGVIGGSGLYEIEGLRRIKEVAVKTPFGAPSDKYITGTLGDAEMVFLPRHGRGHTLSPSEINYRANIYGLKKLGVEHVISVSAVGSMREEIAPGHIVIVDQFIDRTKSRESSFFGGGIVGHVEFADPVCAGLADILYSSAQRTGATAHRGGAYVCIEGPQFSTRAESRVYRSWGVSVIGMTNIPEAKLAREAELCYATMALSTDYDCWHESEESVSVEMVVATMKKNVVAAKAIIKDAVPLISASRDCRCKSAAAHAVLTHADAIPAPAKKRLDLIIGKYIKRTRKG
jgi:5'-methylthioadenosine phosphorylase